MNSTKEGATTRRNFKTLMGCLIAALALASSLLAKLDDAAQVAFEVVRLDHGRVGVYMPGRPDPWSGGILVMTEDRIQSAPIKMVAAVQNLRMLLRGTRQILAGASERTHQLEENIEELAERKQPL